MMWSVVLCREDAYSREVAELQGRCQEADARHEQLAAELPSATTPLLRQLEAMQRSAQQHAAAWAATEAALSQRVTDADAAAAAAGVWARPPPLLYTDSRPLHGRNARRCAIGSTLRTGS